MLLGKNGKKIIAQGWRRTEEVLIKKERKASPTLQNVF